MFNKTLDIIYSQWNHLLCNFNQNWLSRRSLETYCEKIHAKDTPLDNYWGFVDGTVRQMCRPSRNQKIVYGHKRVHSLKFQSVLIPNGFIASLFGFVEGKRHDSDMLRESGLMNDLQNYSFDTNNSLLCLYGAPFKAPNLTNAQRQFNRDMSSVRVAVEWGFGKVTYTVKFVDFKKNLKLLLSPVGKIYALSS